MRWKGLTIELLKSQISKIRRSESELKCFQEVNSLAVFERLKKPFPAFNVEQFFSFVFFQIFISNFDLIRVDEFC